MNKPKPEPTELIELRKSISYPICGARLRKKPGQYCQKKPLEGKTRCRLHGGLSKSGPEAGSYKLGLFCKAVPVHLRDKLKALAKDPGLLDNRTEVAMLNLRLEELSKRLGTGESQEAWKKLQDIFAEMNKAKNEGNTSEVVRCINKAQQIIDKKNDDNAAWKDLIDGIDRATTISSREHRRQVENQMMLTLEQARAIIMAIIEGVNLHVSNPQEKQAVAQHIGRVKVVSALVSMGPDTSRNPTEVGGS